MNSLCGEGHHHRRHYRRRHPYEYRVSVPPPSPLILFPWRVLRSLSPLFRLVVIPVVWWLHGALWHAISFIRNIMPEAPGWPLRGKALCTYARMHVYWSHVESLVNFNFDGCSQPEGKLKKRRTVCYAFSTKTNAEFLRNALEWLVYAIKNCDIRTCSEYTVAGKKKINTNDFYT